MPALIRRQRSDPAQRPFMVIWETTQACDLACRHCRAVARPERDPGELSTPEARRLLDQIRSFGTPPPVLIFTGGDPFKRRDLFELVRHADGIGLPVGVSPSGTPMLSQANLRRLKGAGAKVISLSVDASTPALHDTFRQVPGSFARTLDGWREAREIGLKLQVNTTVTRHNLEDLSRVFRLVQELGAMTWSLFFLVPTGRGREEDVITPAEHEAVLHFLYDVSKYLSAKTTEGHHYRRVVVQRAILEAKGLRLRDHFTLHPVYDRLRGELDAIVAEKGLVPRKSVRRPPMRLNAGDGFVFISHRGEVFPSGFLPLSAGNVRDAALPEIYRESPLFRNLRDPRKLKGRCGRCEFAPVCGGSRSRAFAMTGTPFAEEPFCDYLPGSFPFQEEVAAVVGGNSEPARLLV